MVDHSSPAKDVVLVGLLVDRCPSLLSVLQEHLDIFDELLPHVLFGDVTRWAVARYTERPSDPELAAALELLEHKFSGDDPWGDQLIGGSFLENLPSTTEPGAGIRNRLGERMTNDLRKNGDW
jgi:hypothetical protein